MLEEVVFALKRDTLRDEEFCETLKDTISYISDNSVNAYVVSDKHFLDEQKDIDKKNEMLVIADDPQTSEKLLDEGYYCAGMLHEGNKGTVFPRARYIFSDIGDVDMDSFVKVYQRYAGEPWEVIRTPRLLIRETTIEDVDEFYRIYKDPDITRFMEGLFEDPEDEKRYQKDYIEKVYGLMGFGVWTIIRLSDGCVIGRAGFSVRNGFDDIELGFLIGKEYQRQGYAKEVCRAILDYGRDVLSFERVQTLVKAENEVSIHLCESLGFKRVDEVVVEENIYGNQYKEGQKAALSNCDHGRYIRMTLVY